MAIDQGTRGVQEPIPPGPIAVPVRTFTQPETGSRVTYLPTVHVGEARYWARLARRGPRRASGLGERARRVGALYAAGL